MMKRVLMGLCASFVLFLVGCGDEHDSGSPDSECGNGKVESGEGCDLGAANGQEGSGCSSDCKEVPAAEQPECGNGKVEPGEGCDLGAANGQEGSGCSSDCKEVPQVDMGYVADVKPNPGPETRCNDGKHEAGEVCDPKFIGYVLDGVERKCIVQDGKCVLESVESKKNCGNGILDEGEECDDGNTANSDGCSRNCKLEKGACVIKNGSLAQAYLVVDGDTIKIKVTDDGSEGGCKISNPVSIRMHGIDSPECLKIDTKSVIDPGYHAQVCDPAQRGDYSDKDKSEKGGYEAQEFVNALVFSEENGGKVIVECETRSASDATCLTDATNNRFLAYIRVKKDGRYVDLAEETVRAGYAMAYTDFTSQRLATYCAAEKEAVANKAGVWQYAETFSDVVEENFNSDKNRWLLSGDHCK